MKKITVPAKFDQLDHVIDFIQAELEENHCQVKVQMQIAIAVEEIFVNIAHYAYAPKEGEVEIEFYFNKEQKEASISFIDKGIPYNPLEKADPDITLSAEDRRIGGLGIYLVKKSMDEVLYEYKDNKNRLTIVKKMDKGKERR